jgi:hypothetical protein
MIKVLWLQSGSWIVQNTCYDFNQVIRLNAKGLWVKPGNLIVQNVLYDSIFWLLFYS